MLDILLDGLLDTAKLIPFLYLSYLFIEYIEHRANDNIISNLYRVGKKGPIMGAAAGIIPMCGLSVSAVDLYANKLISAGTLIALLISCSDEALPVLLGSPSTLKAALLLVCSKLILGIIIGIAVDKIFPRFNQQQAHEEHEFMHRDCDDDECEKEGIFLTALFHTLKSSIFVFITLIFLGMAVDRIGEENISSFISSADIFAPFVSSVVGLIPNCVPSYILPTLYSEGVISFGTMLSGLIVNAGVGLAVLWKQNRNKKQNLIFTVILFLVSVIAGTAAHLIIKL